MPTLNAAKRLKSRATFREIRPDLFPGPPGRGALTVAKQKPKKSKKPRLPEPQADLAFVDAHCHFLLPLPKRAKKKTALPAPEAQYQAFRAEGGQFLVSSSIELDDIADIRAFNAMHAHAQFMCGWAPQTVTYTKPAKYRRDWSQWVDFVTTHPDEFLAIGEIGLDFHHARTLPKRERQIAELKKILEVTRPLDKPYVLHVRNPTAREHDPQHPDHPFNAPDGANKPLLEVLREFNVEPARVMWHCFSGPPDYGPALAEQGFVLSVPSSAFGRAKWRKNTADVPLDHLVTETDAYYQHPFRFGPVNVPVNVRYALSAIAWTHGCTQQEASVATVRNARAFFGLPAPGTEDE